MIVNIKIVLSAVLLVFLGGGLLAYAQISSDWGVDVTDPDMYFAATINDSGHVFGQYCFLSQGSCVWVIGLSMRCEEDHKYPILANSDTGAVPLQLVCAGPIKGGHYSYAFTDFDQIEQLVRQSDRVGFAIPMENDEFIVVRFSLRGATPALSKMKEAASKRSKSGPTNTRDKRL